MNKKYDFMNVLRLLSMLAIVFYHSIVTLYLMGIRQLESVSHFYSNANMHIAKVGVGLFFMLSGAGLMLSYKGKEDFGALTFYKKRFFKILVPFYLVYALYFIFLLIENGGAIANIFSGRNAHPISFVFTLFGMDAYLSNFGVATYSLGIGEWFLGCLILMYLVFPLLRKGMLKNRYAFMGGATAYYVMIFLTYNMLPYAESVPEFLNFTVKVYDFILGMFLILVIDNLPKQSMWISAGVLLFYIICPVILPGIDSVAIVIQCAAIFILFSGLEGVLNKAGRLMKIVTILCGYSYEYFLIHHIIIDYMTSRRRNIPFSNLDVLVLFIEEILITSVLTVLVKMILDIPNKIKQKKEHINGFYH